MPGRGRPPGLLGGPLLRRALKHIQEDDEQSSVVTASRGRPKQPSKDDVCDEQPESELSLVVADRNASHLQLLVAMHAQAQSGLDMDDSGRENPAAHILACGRRNIMSNRASKGKYSTQDVRLAASILMESSGLMWSTFLARVMQLLEVGSGWEGLLLAVSRRYDETPLTLRLAEQDPTSQPQGTDSQQSQQSAATSAKKKVTKVMQSEMFVFVLLKHESGKYLQLDGKAWQGSLHLQL